jgi:hypothetical protein
MTERPLAEIRTYEELRAALDARVVQLDTTFEGVDEVAFDGPLGRPMRYTQKLLGRVPVKSIGPISFGPLLGALAVKLLLVEDAELLEKVKPRLKKREEARATGVTQPARRKRRKSAFRGNSAWGKLMRQRQILKQTPIQRQRLARKAGKAGKGAAKRRWSKPQVTEITGSNPAPAACPAPSASTASAPLRVPGSRQLRSGGADGAKSRGRARPRSR